jgi:lipopolysaccharide transport system permease protein
MTSMQQSSLTSLPGAANALPGETSSAEPPLQIIGPTRAWQLVNVRELWRYRELLFFLAWRDLCVRYRQTVLGIAWAMLQPLATMIVFSIFLVRVSPEIGATPVPYTLFAYTGLAAWFFFANAISSAGQSVVMNHNLVTKVYFPRLLIPMSAVLVALVDFAASTLLLVALMVYFGTAPTWGLLLAPVLLLGLLLAALGVGMLLAALTVAYRDFRYVVAFAVQLWLFATPGIYMDTSSWNSAAWLGLNPAHGLISGLRTALLGGAWDVGAILVSVAVSLLLLAAGCLYFRRVERNFADII